MKKFFKVFAILVALTVVLIGGATVLGCLSNK